jgi:hypothetical protein
MHACEFTGLSEAQCSTKGENPTFDLLKIYGNGEKFLCLTACYKRLQVTLVRAIISSLTSK